MNLEVVGSSQTQTTWVREEPKTRKGIPLLFDYISSISLLIFKEAWL
ncbi:hypothetical protein SLEP1_g34309 [Rubroshorea leprosula]|uniref:Uncharacterized protein n=1 Tax=Rubroshorea leprosula TaxID=152421 RepID=A0AAV5KJF2_9ROSI|nr:hypothetical protein SLEP1_g34309 [Rubroshorea leprosula]